MAKRPLSKKARELVEMVAGGVKTGVAARAVNLSDRQARRVIKRSDVQVMLDDMARATLTLAKGPAASKLVSLMDSTSEKVKLDACKHVLSCGGIKPPDGPGVRVSIGIGAFPSRGVITADMSEDEAKAIEAKWGNYGGGGYLLDLREPTQIERVPNEAANA